MCQTQSVLHCNNVIGKQLVVGVGLIWLINFDEK